MIIYNRDFGNNNNQQRQAHKTRQDKTQKARSSIPTYKIQSYNHDDDDDQGRKMNV